MEHVYAAFDAAYAADYDDVKVQAVAERINELLLPFSRELARGNHLNYPDLLVLEALEHFLIGAQNHARAPAEPAVVHRILLAEQRIKLVESIGWEITDGLLSLVPHARQMGLSRFHDVLGGKPSLSPSSQLKPSDEIAAAIGSIAYRIMADVCDGCNPRDVLLSLMTHLHPLTSNVANDEIDQDDHVLSSSLPRSMESRMLIYALLCKLLARMAPARRAKAVDQCVGVIRDDLVFAAALFRDRPGLLHLNQGTVARSTSGQVVTGLDSTDDVTPSGADLLGGLMVAQQCLGLVSAILDVAAVCLNAELNTAAPVAAIASAGVQDTSSACIAVLLLVMQEVFAYLPEVVFKSMPPSDSSAAQQLFSVQSICELAMQMKSRCDTLFGIAKFDSDIALQHITNRLRLQDTLRSEQKALSRLRSGMRAKQGQSDTINQESRGGANTNAVIVPGISNFGSVEDGDWSADTGSDVDVDDASDDDEEDDNPAEHSPELSAGVATVSASQTADWHGLRAQFRSARLRVRDLKQQIAALPRWTVGGVAVYLYSTLASESKRSDVGGTQRFPRLISCVAPVQYLLRQASPHAAHKGAVLACVLIESEPVSTDPGHGNGTNRACLHCVPPHLFNRLLHMCKQLMDLRSCIQEAYSQYSSYWST